MESTENKDAKIELYFHDLTFNGLKLSAKTSRLVVNRVGPEHRGSLPIITQHPDKTSTSPLKALAFVSRLQKKTKENNNIQTIRKSDSYRVDRTLGSNGEKWTAILLTAFRTTAALLGAAMFPAVTSVAAVT